VADEIAWVSSLALALVPMPDLWDRLLDLHTGEGATGRCRACTRPGTGLPGAPWPCAIHIVATQARTRARRQAPGPWRTPS
jgi:hypothetical protein